MEAEAEAGRRRRRRRTRRDAMPVPIPSELIICRRVHQCGQRRVRAAAARASMRDYCSTATRVGTNAHQSVANHMEEADGDEENMLHEQRHSFGGCVARCEWRRQLRAGGREARRQVGGAQCFGHRAQLRRRAHQNTQLVQVHTLFCTHAQLHTR